MQTRARPLAKFRGALLGLAVGDALGAPLEGHLGPVPARRLVRLEREPSRLTYTDDTAMAIALGRSLVDRGGLDLDHLAATLADRYRREPGRGYGAGTAALLNKIADGGDWRRLAAEQFGGEGSYGNGAAMRVAPVALAAPHDLQHTIQLARATARITHTHAEAVEAAAIQAAAVHLALEAPAGHLLDRALFLQRLEDIARGTPMEQRLALVAGVLDSGEVSAAMVAEQVGTGIAAIEAVPAALAAFLSNPDSFRDTVRFAISLGGDTDTIAAMAGAMAGAHLGDRAIPTPWLHRTEGVEELIAVADALHRLAAA